MMTTMGLEKQLGEQEGKMLRTMLHSFPITFQKGFEVAQQNFKSNYFELRAHK